MKQSFNDYELALLKRALEEEKNGVHIHSWPINETEESYIRYFFHKTESNYQILKKLLNWWSVYFACGEDKARAILKEHDEMILNKLAAEKEQTAAAALTRLNMEVK